MIPQKQRYRHDPASGVWGDCHSAALASILELPVADVPHFADGGPSPDEFNKRIREWLRGMGLVQIDVPYEAGLDLNLNRLQTCLASINPGIYYILGGHSRNGVNHSVVCLNGEIVHDPALDDSGIVGPCDDEMYWVSFIGVDLGDKCLLRWSPPRF